MAQLDVQPKKSNPWWIWLLLAVVILGLIFYFMRDRGNTSEMAKMDDSTNVSSVTTDNDDWGMIDRNVPEANYDEISGSDVTVRGNDQYAVYSVDEAILFDSEKSTIREQAAENLKQIAGSAEKRFSGGQVRIYGFTDSRGDAAKNKELAQQRAEAVKNWLAENGKIATDRISVNAVGEAQPVASNQTEAGRQQNRRVEIVIRRQ